MTAPEKRTMSQMSREEIRLAACEAMDMPDDTREVTCAWHGETAPIEDVYAMNNWELSDGELKCDGSHPYCFEWCVGGQAYNEAEFAKLRTPAPESP